MRAILGANVVTHVAGLVVNVRAISSSLVTSQVWVDVVAHVVFAALFVFFYERIGARSPRTSSAQSVAGT